MANKAVAVERHLGIHCNDAVIAGLQNWVDLKHGGITSCISRIKLFYKDRHFFEGLALEPQVKSDLPALKIIHAGERVNRLFENALGGIVSYIFNVHSTIG